MLPNKIQCFEQSKHGEKDGIRQKIPSSRNEGNVLNANFNSDGNLNVNSNLNRENHNPNLGFRSEVESCFIVLLIFSILQASCLFPEGFPEVQDGFYWLMQEYLLRALKGFLKGQF